MVGTKSIIYQLSEVVLTNRLSSTSGYLEMTTQPVITLVLKGMYVYVHARSLLYVHPCVNGCAVLTKYYI